MDSNSLPRMAVQISSRTSGRTWTIQPGTIADLRRDEAAAVALAHRKVSRSGHATLTAENGSWMLVADSGKGLFVNGTLTRKVAITGRKIIRVGEKDEGEDLDVTLVTAKVAAPQPTDGGAVGPVSTGGGSGAVPGGEAEVGTPRGDVRGKRIPRTDRDTTPAGGGHPTDPLLTDRVGGPGPSGPARGLPLTVSVGTRTVTLPGEPGEHFIGRDEHCEFPVEDSRASRRHLVLTFTGKQWEMADQSSRGTFRDPGGERLPKGQPIPITGATVLRLGDATTGEPVALTPAGAVAGATPRKRLAIIGAAAAVLLIALAGTVFALNANDDEPSAGGGGGGGAGEPPTDVIDRVRGSVVRLTMFDAEGEAFGAGSGTVISEDGLIITNSHVADPNAPGLAVHYGVQQEPDVAHLAVGVTTVKDQAVEDLYRAELLVSDGYLDVAVIQITGKADGSPVEPSEIDLPALPIGDSAAAATGDEVTVLGFPGQANSRSVSVETGQISSLTRDDRLDSDRAYFETSADIRGGNSGGTAINADGELIGIPSSEIFSPDAKESSNQIRPIDWAEEVLAIAEQGKDLDYVSPHIVVPTGNETAAFVGATNPDEPSCEEVAPAIPAESAALTVFTVEGAKAGLDVFPLLLTVDEQGAPGTLAAAGFPLNQVGPDPPCVIAFMDPLPAGQYIGTVAAYDKDGIVFLGKPMPVTVGEAGAAPSSQEETPSDGPTTAAPANGICNSGRAVADWVGQQSIHVPEVTSEADNSVLIEGGKTLVVALLGSETGFGTPDEAAQAAYGAVNHNLGPQPYQGVSDQRWVVVGDNASRYWAFLGQHRDDTVIMTNPENPHDFEVMENPDGFDWCMTPDTDYELVAWYATMHDGDGTWSVYDSTTNQVTGL